MFPLPRVWLCIMIFINNSYHLWLVSGLLLGVGFYINSLWYLGIVGGAIFLYQILEERSAKDIFLGAGLAWFIKYAISIIYFWNTYPVDFLPLEFSWVQVPIIFLYWFTGAAWLALGVGVVVLSKITLVHFLPKLNFFITVLVLALVFVWGEIAGSFIFSVMTLGPGGGLNTAFSFGYSGYLLAEHGLLIQAGKVLGVYSLSFLFYVLSGFIFILFKQQKVWFALASIAVLAVSANWPWINSTDYQDTHSVLVIDTEFSARAEDKVLKLEERNSLLEAMELALETQSDYILLPEGADFFKAGISDAANLNILKNQYQNSSSSIIDSRTLSTTGGMKLEAYLYDSVGREFFRVDKRYLVPQGEYVPVLYSSLFKLLGPDALVEYIEDNLNFVVGDNTSQAPLKQNLPAVLFCFESVDPLGASRIIAEHQEAPFIAHPVSHTWFSQSEMMWNQLDNKLKVQAVWSQKYIVTASNQGRSRAYTPTGKIVELEEVGRGDGWSAKTIDIPRIK